MLYNGKERVATREFKYQPSRRIVIIIPDRKCETLNGMDLREIGWDGIDWIELAQDRNRWRALVNRAMNLWVP
jgi:hypothetical protein